ncbi:hypothetical protein M3Y98_00138600 [Aphelenchoides besseyi]|nr:hypothetical protein M3Y98_00138600 [Aphelenchoides besseyi]
MKAKDISELEDLESKNSNVILDTKVEEREPELVESKNIETNNSTTEVVNKPMDQQIQQIGVAKKLKKIIAKIPSTNYDSNRSKDDSVTDERKDVEDSKQSATGSAKNTHIEEVPQEQLDESKLGTPTVESKSQSKSELARNRAAERRDPNFRFVQLKKVPRKTNQQGKEAEEQKIKPKFNPRRKLIECSKGGVVVASVKCMACPEPKLSIYHNGDFMEENELMRVIVDKDKCVYTICLCLYRITPDMGGKISLVATNEVGSDETTIFIDVKGSCKDFSFTNLVVILDTEKVDLGELPSVECTTPEHIDTTVGSTVDLDFTVRSNTPPEIWMEFNGVMIDNQEHVEINYDGNVATVHLRIAKCTIADSGHIACCCANKYGSSRSPPVYLNVQQSTVPKLFGDKTPPTLKRKKIPGSLLIPREINSLYGDPSVFVSTANITTELSAVDENADTQSISPIKQTMSAIVSKSVELTRRERNRRKKRRDSTQFSFKRARSAPADYEANEEKTDQQDILIEEKHVDTHTKKKAKLEREPSIANHTSNQSVENILSSPSPTVAMTSIPPTMDETKSEDRSTESVEEKVDDKPSEITTSTDNSKVPDSLQSQSAKKTSCPVVVLDTDLVALQDAVDSNTIVYPKLINESISQTFSTVRQKIQPEVMADKKIAIAEEQQIYDVLRLDDQLEQTELVPDKEAISLAETLKKRTPRKQKREELVAEDTVPVGVAEETADLETNVQDDLLECNEDRLSSDVNNIDNLKSRAVENQRKTKRKATKQKSVEATDVEITSELDSGEASDQYSIKWPQQMEAKMDSGLVKAKKTTEKLRQTSQTKPLQPTDELNASELQDTAQLQVVDAVDEPSNISTATSKTRDLTSVETELNEQINAFESNVLNSIESSCPIQEFETAASTMISSLDDKKPTTPIEKKSFEFDIPLHTNEVVDDLSMQLPSKEKAEDFVSTKTAKNLAKKPLEQSKTRSKTTVEAPIVGTPIEDVEKQSKESGDVEPIVKTDDLEDAQTDHIMLDDDHKSNDKLNGVKPKKKKSIKSTKRNNVEPDTVVEAKNTSITIDLIKDINKEMKVIEWPIRVEESLQQNVYTRVREITYDVELLQKEDDLVNLPLQQSIDFKATSIDETPMNSSDDQLKPKIKQKRPSKVKATHEEHNPAPEFDGSHLNELQDTTYKPTASTIEKNVTFEFAVQNERTSINRPIDVFEEVDANIREQPGHVEASLEVYLTNEMNQELDDSTVVVLPEKSAKSIVFSYKIKQRLPKETSLVQESLTRTKELDTTDLRAEVEIINTNGQKAEDLSRLIDLSKDAEEPISISDADEKKPKRKRTQTKATESEHILSQDNQIASISEGFTAKESSSEVDTNWSIATNEMAIKTIRPTISVGKTESNLKETINDDHRTTTEQTPETAAYELVSVNNSDQYPEKIHQSTMRLPSKEEDLSVEEAEVKVKFDAKPSLEFVENNLSDKEKKTVVQNVSTRSTNQTMVLEKTSDFTGVPLKIVQSDIEKTQTIEEDDGQSKAKKRIKLKRKSGIAKPMEENEIAVQRDANLMFDENAETVAVNWTHDSREKQERLMNIKARKQSAVDAKKTENEADPAVESITEVNPKTNGHLIPNENTNGKKRKKTIKTITNSLTGPEETNEVDKTVELTARLLQVEANANLKMENKESVAMELRGRKSIDEQKKENQTVDYTSINVPIDPPTFDNEMHETIEFDAKEELRLRCRFTCSTTPEITTTVNGTPLNSQVFTSTINANEIVLVKPNASKLDGGVFYITIKTQFGEATKKIDVVVHDVPDAPESLRIVNFGVNFVKLEWEKPISDGGSPIKFYRIEMKQQNRRAFKRAGQVDGIERSFVIADLDENTTYEFRVAGINKFGTGDFKSTELTTENQYSAPVISAPPRIKEFSEKLCVLEWEDCEQDGNSPVYSYDVYVQEDDGKPMKVNTEDVFCTKFAVKDRIKPGHSYAFKIEARNEAGLVSQSDIFTEPRFCSTKTEYSDSVLPAPVVLLTKIDSVSVQALDLPETVEYTVFFKSESNNKWEQLTTNEAAIVIPNLKHGLSYTFKIEAKTADGMIHRSEETDLILIEDEKKPRIIKEIRDVEVAEKKRLQLECRALGESISFTWTKDEVELYAETSVMICNEGHSSVLKIENVRPSDAGVYKCKVANSHAELETKAKVAVADVDAYFESTFPESIAVIEGETLRLSCTVSDSDAKVTFKKNGQPITPDDSNIKIIVDETTRELVLEKVNADDQGEYVCLLSDGQKAKCKVTINEPEAHVHVGPQNQIVTAHNQNVALTCYLTRNAKVEWLKNGTKLSLESLGAKYKIFSEDTKSILEINDFNDRDIGEYSCRLINPAYQLTNKEESLPATLDLQIKPQIEFLSDVEKVEINVGSDLKMTFNLNGYPTPQIEGELNGIPFADLSFSQTFEDGKATIKIRSIEREHAGILTIRAVNSFGDDEKSIQLCVKDVPTSPRNVVVKLIGTNSAEVTWSAADLDDQCVTSYVVERQSGMFNRWRQCGVVMADQPLRLVVEELPWDEIVNFRVVSQNEIGRSKPSTIVDVTTKSGSESDESEINATATAIIPQADQPFEAPTLTRMKDGVQLTWKAIEKVKLYAIERRKAGEKTWMKIGQTSHTSFVDRTITPTAGCSYRVVVNLENSTMKVSVPVTDDDSLETTEFIEETSTVDPAKDYVLAKSSNKNLDVVEKKTSVDKVPTDDIVELPKQSNTSVMMEEKNLTASKSKEDNIDDEISSIALSRKSESKSSVEMVAEVKDARLFESDELPQSIVTNQNEKNVKSTDATVPIKISSLEVLQVNDDSIQLQWAAAIHRPSFKGFVVEKYSNSFGQWQCVAKCTEPITKISGLSQTETYKFRVASESTNGIMSDFVEAAPVHLTVRNKRTSKPKEDKKLSEITDLEVLSTDNDCVELIWVTESSGQPRTFIVEGCRMDDGDEGEWIPMSRTTDMRAKICNLDQNVDYRFRVLTEDSTGKRSEASISKLVHVPGRQIDTVPLKLVQPLINVDVESGDEEDVVLSCRFVNIPTDAIITWSKDGRPISSAGRRKFASEIDATGVAILRIRDPTNSDIGGYKCTIAHKGVEQSSESQLNVRPRIANKRLDVDESTNSKDRQKQSTEEDEFIRKRTRKRLIEEDDEQIEPLRFLHELHDDEVTIGDSATFSIAYHSAVVPEIEWYYNGNRVIALPGRFRLSNDYGRSTFTVENVTVDCAGEWMVLVRTPTEEFRSRCTLKVNERRSTTSPSKTSSFEQREDGTRKVVVDQKSDEESIAADEKQQRELSPIEEDQSIVLSKRKSDEFQDAKITKRPRVRREDRETETGSPPVFHHLLSDLNARVGERVVLSVTSTTMPAPTVSWMRNGTPIKRTDANYVVRSDCGRYELEILSCQRQDDAEFTIIGVNKFGRCESSCQLRVVDRTREEAPEFGFELHDVQCQVGSMLILEASVRSRPEASISWWKDGKEITVGREFRMIGDGRIQSLSVLDALPVHSGEYEIRAENIHGIATSKCTVTVNDPVHDQFSVIETRAPVVRLPLTPIRELPEGSEVHLVCTIISTSAIPKIEWLKDQLPINFPAVFRFHHGVAELIIERAECHHSGVFTVIASNAYGTCRSTGVLYVQPSTDTKTGPPKFVELLTNSSLVAGQELVLECQVSTNPLPTIKWWKDGFQILSDPRLLLYTDRRGVARLNLMDCKVSDSGEYSCEAISSFGRDFTHSQVKIVAEVEEEERRRIGGELPVIIRPLSDCYIHYGNQKILEAEIRSFTSTNIEFLHNGRPLAETRTLHAEHAHSGEYEIVFTNRYGQASSRASVVVESPETEGYVSSMPVFIQSLQSVKLTAIGETVEFRCVVKGQPQPNVQFLQNGKAVTEEDDGNVTITTKENEHLLRINSCTASWIGSQVTAAASNIFGLVHSNAEITLETDTKQD